MTNDLRTLALLDEAMDLVETVPDGESPNEARTAWVAAYHDLGKRYRALREELARMETDESFRQIAPRGARLRPHEHPSNAFIHVTARGFLVDHGSEPSEDTSPTITVTETALREAMTSVLLEEFSHPGEERQIFFSPQRAAYLASLAIEALRLDSDPCLAQPRSSETGRALGQCHE